VRTTGGAFDVNVLAGGPVLPTPLLLPPPPLPPGEKMLFSEALRVLFLEITAKLQDDAGDLWVLFLTKGCAPSASQRERGRRMAMMMMGGYRYWWKLRAGSGRKLVL
jgi:hypothetical protein